MSTGQCAHDVSVCNEIHGHVDVVICGVDLLKNGCVAVVGFSNQLCERLGVA